MHKLLISSHLLTLFIFIFHFYFLLLPSVNILFYLFVLMYLLKLGGKQLWNNFCTVTQEMLLSPKFSVIFMNVISRCAGCMWIHVTLKCSESVMWKCDTAGFWLTGGFSCLHDNKGLWGKVQLEGHILFHFTLVLCPQTCLVSSRS